nr:hypothetical protein [Tanacetum cinerariifolium]
MTSFNQRECVGYGQPCDGFYWYLCTCQQCGVNLINGICLNCTYGDGKPVTCYECEGPLNGGFCLFCALRVENSFAYDPNTNSFDDSQNLSDYPPQPQYQTYCCELCGNDAHYGYDCPPQVSEYLENSSNAITPDLPTEEPDNSLSMGDEHLSTISETKSDEVIKSSVEDLVPILSKSKDTSEKDSECILPSCDDFSSINIFEEKSMTLSNPLFNSNDDFTSSDDESLSDEVVMKENVKIYSNPLFKFDDEYISSDADPLFVEVLENIECKDSYDSNLNESPFLVTPLSDSNEDEYFTPGDDVELLLHRDLSILKMIIALILEGFTNEPPLEENANLFDLEYKNNKWKKILYDAPIKDLMSEDKVLTL